MYIGIIRRKNRHDSLTHLVHELAEEIQGNLQVVPIDGFDEVMDALVAARIRKQQPDYHQTQITAVPEALPSASPMI